jgi:hypothetical protein
MVGTIKMHSEIKDDVLKKKKLFVIYLLLITITINSHRYNQILRCQKGLNMIVLFQNDV